MKTNGASARGQQQERREIQPAAASGGHSSQACTMGGDRQAGAGSHAEGDRQKTDVSSSAAEAELGAQAKEDLQHLYNFAERFKLLVLCAGEVPKRPTSSKDVLQYLCQYLGEAPVPKEGERWEESMAELFRWATGEDITAADAEQCFSLPDEEGPVQLHIEKLHELDVHYELWVTPYLRDDVLNAQEQSLLEKRRVSFAGKKLLQVGEGQGGRSHAAASPAEAGGELRREEEGARGRIGQQGGMGGGMHGVGQSSPGSTRVLLSDKEKLQCRLLMHLATSTGAVTAKELLDRKFSVPEPEVYAALEELEYAGAVRQVGEAGKEEKGLQEYEATEVGQQELQRCRQALLAHAREERSSKEVDEGLAFLGSEVEWRYNTVWYKGTVKHFDGWDIMVEYSDGDQVWRNSTRDRNFRVLPNRDGASNKSSSGRPSKASPKRERNGGGGKPAAAGKEPAPALAGVPSVDGTSMYGGEFDIGAVEQEAARNRRCKPAPAEKGARQTGGQEAGAQAGEGQAPRVVLKSRAGPLNFLLTGMVRGDWSSSGQQAVSSGEIPAPAQEEAVSSGQPSQEQQQQPTAPMPGAHAVAGGRRRKREGEAPAALSSGHEPDVLPPPEPAVPTASGMEAASADGDGGRAELAPDAAAEPADAAGQSTAATTAPPPPPLAEPQLPLPQELQQSLSRRSDSAPQAQAADEASPEAGGSTGDAGPGGQHRVGRVPAGLGKALVVRPKQLRGGKAARSKAKHTAREVGHDEEAGAAAPAPSQEAGSEPVPTAPAGHAQQMEEDPKATLGAGGSAASQSLAALAEPAATGVWAPAAEGHAAPPDTGHDAAPGSAAAATAGAGAGVAVAPPEPPQAPPPRGGRQSHRRKTVGAPKLAAAAAGLDAEGHEAPAELAPAVPPVAAEPQLIPRGDPAFGPGAEGRWKAGSHADGGQAGAAAPAAADAGGGDALPAKRDRRVRTAEPSTHLETGEDEAAQPQQQRRRRQAAQAAAQRGFAISSDAEEDAGELLGGDREAGVGQGIVPPKRVRAAQRARQKDAAQAAAATAAAAGDANQEHAGGGGGAASLHSLLVDAPGTQLTKQDCYWWQRTGAAAEPARKEKREGTKSCHDCQRQHVIWPCQSGKGCLKTYCTRCTDKYDYLFEGGHEEDLEKFCQGWCPCCIGICGVMKCLRKTLTALHQPPPEVPVSQDQTTVLALHMAFQLMEPAMHILAQNHAEAARQGMRLEDVRQGEIGIMDGKQVPASERVLCNRCATAIENAHYQCSSCNRDLCVSCAAELQGPPEAHPGPVPCFGCGRRTQLQQFLSPQQVKLLAGAWQQLQRVFERGPLSAHLQSLYDIHRRTWLVEGQPLAASLKLLQQHHQQQPSGNAAMGSAAAHTRRSRKRRGRPDEADQAAAAEHAEHTSGGKAEQSHGAHAASGTQQHSDDGGGSLQANAVQDGSGGTATGAKRQRRPSQKAVELQQAAFWVQTEAVGAASPMQQLANGAVHGREVQVAAAASQAPQARNASTVTNNVELQAEQDGFIAHHRFPPALVSNLQTTCWWELHSTWVRPEDLRLAAQRPGGVQNVIWTPHISIFAKDSPLRGNAVRLFTERWQLGEPVVVRGFLGRLDWGPATMERVTRDMRPDDKTLHLNVLDCKDFSSTVMKCRHFFDDYTACHGDTLDAQGRELPMYKLKDWPMDASFAEKLARHNDDFLAMLNSCMPVYTHPAARITGMLNLANHLPWYTLKPDIGPKGYIAYGREKEHPGGGDSVTKLHEDLSEAINIMCHTQLPPGMEKPKPRCGPDQLWDPELYGYAGAVWDVFRCEDRTGLMDFLMTCVRGGHPDLPLLMHQGRRLEEEDVYHPIHAQCVMLTEAHRKVLREKYGVHPWHFEQYCWEGVFVPGGSPHQVRNLRSSIKVALDFVTPENLPECLRLRDEFRKLVLADVEKGRTEEDPSTYYYADRLQVRNMVLSGLEWALRTLEAREDEAQHAAQH